MVYREKEVEALRQAYQAMRQSNRMQLRFICGEAGTGKTALANMFVNALSPEAEQTLFVSTYCGIRSEYNIPYQPFKELLKHLLQDVKEGSESERTQKDKIKGALSFCGKMLLEHAPDLVGNFIPGASLISAIGQAVFKDKKAPEVVEESKILEQYVDAIRAIAQQYSLVLVIDDLQWIDNLSVNLLYHLIMGLQNSPVLIIGCYRSTDIDIAVNGEKHPLSKLITEVKINQGNVFVNLDALSETDRKNLMNSMLDAEPNSYDSRFREKLFEHTGGNPLFVSELVDLLKEESMIVSNNDGVWMNNAELRWSSYPMRIEGIIQERIGRLEDSLVEVLSHASVQGYNFIAQVLLKTTGGSERDLLMTLSKTLQKQHHLVCEGSCIRSTQGMVSRFNFSNYVFQQYLYEELSMTQRMMLHSDIAGILEELFKNNIEEVAGDIARHYEMSNEYEKAIQYIKITVSSIMSLSAYQEAIVLCKKALSIIDSISSQDMRHDILFFEAQLCICYRFIKGWGDAEMEATYHHADELSKELSCYDYYDIILFGLWGVHLARLDLEKCLETAQRYLDVAQKQQNASTEASATLSMINTLYWMGDFDKLAEYVLLFEQKDHPEVMQQENDAMNRITVCMFALLLSYHKSDAAQGAERKAKMRALMATYKGAPYQVMGHQALAWYALLVEDGEALSEHAMQLMSLSKQNDFPTFYNIGRIFFGASLKDENAATNLSHIEEGYRTCLSLFNSDPVAMHSVYGLAMGRYYLRSREYEQFLRVSEEIVEVATAKKECCYLPELYLQRVQCYHELKDMEQAQAASEKAMEWAARNGAIIN